MSESSEFKNPSGENRSSASDCDGSPEALRELVQDPH